MRFWGVEKVPSELIEYVAKSSHQSLSDMLSHFAKEIKIVDFLRLLNLELHHIRPSTHKRWIFWESQDYKFKTTVECVVHILAVQFQRERGQIWNKRTAALAVELGRLDCLTFSHEFGCPWDASTSEKAAEYNRLDCLKYAHTHGCPWDARTTTTALKKRNMDCYLYVQDHGCPCDETTCAAAARLDNLSVLKFAHENGCPWDKSTCTEAATADSLACLKYARERGCPWGASTCAAAAGAGNLAILTYAHKQGCPWVERTYRNAAKGGHLHCLRYAHEQGCPWDTRTCTAAAFSQSSACLAYAHKNGCPWNKEVIKEATWHGRIECLRYALENGCPGREIACGHVLNSVECLRYLREEQKCPWDVHIVDYFAGLLWWYTDCLRYCLQRGCLADEHTMLLAAKHFEKIKVLREYGCPWDKRTLHAVAKEGDLKAFQYCIENKCPGREDVVLHAAAHLPLLKYLHAEGFQLQLPRAYKCALAADRPIECVRFLYAAGKCRWHARACTWFVQHRRMDCLKYAHMHGAPWDADTCAAAAHLETKGKEEQQRALDFLQYLHEEGCPWDESTLRAARKCENSLCIQYALEQGCSDIDDPSRSEGIDIAGNMQARSGGQKSKRSDVQGVKVSSSGASGGAPVDTFPSAHQDRKKRKRSGIDEEQGVAVRRSQRISQVGAAFGQCNDKGNRLVAGGRGGERLDTKVRRSERNFT